MDEYTNENLTVTSLTEGTETTSKVNILMTNMYETNSIIYDSKAKIMELENEIKSLKEKNMELEAKIWNLFWKLQDNENTFKERINNMTREYVNSIIV